jgi:hypothetical protein
MIDKSRAAIKVELVLFCIGVAVTECIYVSGNRF